ncbi:MAG: endonuclease III domain-containing protein [Clostridia bacterium]|nr:MAG: endonuclease III domain-containing protein [Clostridia bacterium]
MTGPEKNCRAFLLEVYRRLLDHFGLRHWWPADTPLEVCVGAILTQNVAWRNVERAIANLKEQGLLVWDNLARAAETEIEPLIVPTRFYKTKARKLAAFVRFIAENYGSLETMFADDLAVLRPRLLKVWGLGPETVDSILLYAGEKPTFVVDAYTRRVFSRLGVVPPDISYEDLRAFFQGALPPDVPLYNEYHAQIDALGHHLCLNQQPRCGACPLGQLCPFPGTLKAPSAVGKPGHGHRLEEAGRTGAN